jgi:hypothetical protein
MWARFAIAGRRILDEILRLGGDGAKLEEGRSLVPLAP